MSQSSPGAQGTASLVRLSVSSGTRRADLGIPGSIPVAEVIPDLARELGVLDARSASLGYRLVRPDGGVVDNDRSLAAQSIEDGAVLVLEPGRPDGEKVYDDVVEAVADLVETQFTPWTAANSSGTAVGAAGVLFVAAAYALFTARDSGLLVAALAGVCAVLLVGAAAVLAHVRKLPSAAVALALTAVPYAAVAGFAAFPDAALWGEGLTYAGGAVAVVGTLGALAVTRQRLLVAAVAVVGVAMLLLGALTHFVGWDMTTVAACVFLVAALVGNVLPWVGLSSSRLTTHPPKSDVEIFADVPEVERDAVRRQVAAGHELMIGLGVASAAVMVLCTPQLVASGLWGTLLVAVGFVATLLRTRHSRTRTTVLIAMIAGITGTAVAAVTAAQTHPGWRPVLALGLSIAAAVVVGLALVLPRTRVQLGRVADGIEGVALVALVPLAALAVGLL
ncbi:type VII secretion integral membrane protein EccD [Knoellia remsis]|uniref:Type VII secretion integral membrane protein EccD n=1 Tax=Knoellia remsis TaxID=407159 RepID=A0A2T0UED3_9MICO|nr:type VII secretion integral membrane protein EccD [Knoellia remsis]PRY56311.1 type VII secretion integral membrane protein EccD [Knoellia remsis]